LAGALAEGLVGWGDAIRAAASAAARALEPAPAGGAGAVAQREPVPAAQPRAARATDAVEPASPDRATLAEAPPEPESPEPPLAAPVAVVPPASDVLAAAWLLFHALPDAIGRGGDMSQARAWIDDWRLAPVIANAFRDDGIPEADAWRSVEAVKALLTLPAWDLLRALPARAAAILDAWHVDESVARFLQVNAYRDVRWFNREAFLRFARWAGLVQHTGATTAPPALPADAAVTSGAPAADAGRIEAAPEAAVAETVSALLAAAEASGYRFDDLVALSQARVPADRPAE
jgi:hypothetical protein